MTELASALLRHRHLPLRISIASVSLSATAMACRIAATALETSKQQDPCTLRPSADRAAWVLRWVRDRARIAAGRATINANARVRCAAVQAGRYGWGPATGGKRSATGERRRLLVQLYEVPCRAIGDATRRSNRGVRSVPAQFPAGTPSGRRARRRPANRDILRSARRAASVPRCCSRFAENHVPMQWVAPLPAIRPSIGWSRPAGRCHSAARAGRPAPRRVNPLLLTLQFLWRSAMETFSNSSDFIGGLRCPRARQLARAARPRSTKESTTSN